MGSEREGGGELSESECEIAHMRVNWIVSGACVEHHV